MATKGTKPKLDKVRTRVRATAAMGFMGSMYLAGKGYGQPDMVHQIHTMKSYSFKVNVAGRTFTISVEED